MRGVPAWCWAASGRPTSVVGARRTSAAPSGGRRTAARAVDLRRCAPSRARSDAHATRARSYGARTGGQAGGGGGGGGRARGRGGGRAGGGGGPRGGLG